MSFAVPRRRIGAALVALGLAPLIAVPAMGAQAATSEDGQVYIVHGVAGETYDVQIDGDSVGTAVAPKTVVGPLELSPGKHEVSLVKDGSPAVSGTVTVEAGKSVDVVAHRRSDVTQAPAVTVFPNDTTPVAPGKTRLAVAHTAAAPPADIVVDGKPLFENVANAEALTVVVPAATYEVQIVPSAGGATVLGPVDLPVEAGTLTRVFAIGDASKGTMDAIVQSLEVPVEGASAPDRVRTGDGGQAAVLFTNGSSGWNGGAAGAGISITLVLASAALLVVARRRRRETARQS